MEVMEGGAHWEVGLSGEASQEGREAGWVGGKVVQVEGDGVGGGQGRGQRDGGGQEGRWRHQDGARPEGNSEMVRATSCLEGGLQEDPTGGRGSRQQFSSSQSLGGCGESRLWQGNKGVCGSLEGPRKVKVRPPEPLPAQAEA